MISMSPQGGFINAIEGGLFNVIARSPCALMSLRGGFRRSNLACEEASDEAISPPQIRLLRFARNDREVAFAMTGRLRSQ